MEYDNNEIVREFIITESLRKLVAKNIDSVNESTHLFRRLFAEATRIMLSEVNADIYALRREMSRRKLRIVNEESAQDTLIVRYMVRSSAGTAEEKAELQREELRREIGLRLARRMKAMEERVKRVEAKATAEEKENAAQPK